MAKKKSLDVSRKLYDWFLNTAFNRLIYFGALLLLQLLWIEQMTARLHSVRIVNWDHINSIKRFNRSSRRDLLPLISSAGNAV